jgi:hypothetical protein
MKSLILAAALLLLLTSAGTAQTNIPWSVIGSGGVVGAQGNNRVLSATIGQVVIGVGIITDGSQISQGFWLPIDREVSVDEEGGQTASGSISNYPNPFSSSTTIRFTAPVEGPVTIRVFDLVGNLVRSIEAEMSLAGTQEIVFDGLGDGGAPLGAGTYLYEASGISSTGERFVSVQRMTILR